MKIDAKAIRQLADLLNETGLTEIEVAEGDQMIRVNKGGTFIGGAPAHHAPANFNMPSDPAVPQQANTAAPSTITGDHPGAVTSPMVGTAYLAPEPSALFRLLQQPPGWMSEDDRRGLEAASEEFSLMLRDMHTLQDRIKFLQEEVAATVNEDNNKSLFVLTVVTVLALPINILAGLFGMNVGGIPLAEHKHGFWIVVSLVLTFTAIAAWIAFRRKRSDR